MKTRIARRTPADTTCFKKSIQLARLGFESSTVKTPEFKAFAQVFKKELTQELNKIGAKLTDYSVGHFDVSGFFKVLDQYYYFSIPDVRWNPADMNILVRTAKNEHDYTGGSNHFVTASRFNKEIGRIVR